MHLVHYFSTAYMQVGSKCGIGTYCHSKYSFSLAHVQMRKRGAHQSLVVSGESGAGKTEVNKQCMNYLVRRHSK